MTDIEKQSHNNDAPMTSVSKDDVDIVIHDALEKQTVEEITSVNKVTQDENTALENVTQDETETASNGGGGSFGLALIAACISIIALAIALWGFLGSKTETYRLVDLAEISRFYQEQAREQGLKEGVTNEQRGMILGRLQGQMGALKHVTEAYAKECDCTLFVRSAIVADNGKSVDVSNEIVKRINDLVEKQGVTSVQIPNTAIPIPPPSEAGGSDD